MIEIICDEEKLKEQILLVIKLFLDKNSLEKANISITHKSNYSNDGLLSEIWLKYSGKTIYKRSFLNNNEIDLNTKNLYHYIERESKIIVYKINQKIHPQFWH